LGGILYGVNDLDVPGAAAQIAGNGLFNLFARWVRSSVKESPRRQKHTGRTDAALRAAKFQKSPLKRIELAVPRQTFDRCHRASVQLAYRDQAGIDYFSIDENRAGAALPFSTALLGPGEPQVFAQDIQKTPHRRGVYFSIYSVDLKLNLHKAREMKPQMNTDEHR
jgi:hypothetical protein